MNTYYCWTKDGAVIQSPSKPPKFEEMENNRIIPAPTITIAGQIFTTDLKISGWRRS